MKKLAIVGTHTRTRDQAPWDDPNHEIWVFNEAPQQAWCQRWDAVFQMHKSEVYRSENNFVRTDHWQWLQQARGKPIWMQSIDPLVPDSLRYPLDEILSSIPGANLRWFKSTPAYALALALWRGYSEIDLYGLDMASNTEYGYQLANFQFWVGITLGMGVKIGVLSNEKYFSGSLYAYDGEIQIARDHFNWRVETLKSDKKHAEWNVKKAKDSLYDALKIGHAAKAGTLLADYQEMVIANGQASGALDEALRYASREDLIPRQEFERTAAQAQVDAEDARREMWKASGEAQYVWNAWNQTGSEKACDQLRVFIEKQIGKALEHGYRTGRCRENMAYMLKVDDLITAAGGARTLAALGVPA